MDDLARSEEVVVIEEVIVEEYVVQGRELPHAQRYVIRIDKDRRVVTTPRLKGREILALVDKTPERYKLYLHEHKQQPRLIGPDDEVDLHRHRVERFTTMAKDTTEGRGTAALRREFRLPEEDEQYLDRLGLPWEAIRDGQTQWLILQGWKVPTGYNHAAVAVALLIPPGYADSQIDMVYFYPPLALTDGRPIGALAGQLICGQHWQRWSRHRTPANPWRPGVDGVASHLALVDEWLHREFARAAS